MTVGCPKCKYGRNTPLLWIKPQYQHSSCEKSIKHYPNNIAGYIIPTILKDIAEKKKKKKKKKVDCVDY